MERSAINTVSRHNTGVVLMNSQQLWSVTCLTPPCHGVGGRPEALSLPEELLKLTASCRGKVFLFSGVATRK